MFMIHLLSSYYLDECCYNNYIHGMACMIKLSLHCIYTAAVFNSDPY